MNVPTKVCSAAVVLAALTLSLSAAESDVTGVENAVLTQAPNVPPPITRKYSTKVVVNLEIREITKTLADGVQYVFWTFGGNVPGNFIRIREGDEVEFHLNNDPDSKMPHSIDLHAVTGPGGGAASSFTAPGHSSQFSFRALNSGLYIYHCATAPVGMHIANGMYGLILVEPKEGLPPADHEYYVMQGEFYTAGKYGEAGLQTFDLEKAVDERPTYVVFNGAVGSITGNNALTARVGDTARIYFGNGGPNLASAFHVIGDQFDTLYPDGTLTNMLHDVQTTLVPPGSAVIVDFKVKVPGNYSLVDHSIFRAFNQGAVGTLTVSGPDNLAIYSGKQADTIYAGDPAGPKDQSSAETQNNFQASASGGATQIEKGRALYMQSCFVCHQPNGAGLANLIPPLAKSDFLAHLSTKDFICGVVNGRKGAITVNGRNYNGVMTPVSYLTDQQLADVLSYVRKSFGNTGDAVTLDEVAKVRRQITAPLAQNSFE